jgi:hypothetical protein
MLPPRFHHAVMYRPQLPSSCGALQKISPTRLARASTVRASAMERPFLSIGAKVQELMADQRWIMKPAQPSDPNLAQLTVWRSGYLFSAFVDPLRLVNRERSLPKDAGGFVEAVTHQWRRAIGHLMPIKDGRRTLYLSSQRRPIEFART